MADVLTFHEDTFFVQGFYAHRISVLAQSKKVAGAILIVSSRNNDKASKTLKMSYHTQLSFIQLGGGIAIGIQGEREKYYSVLNTPDIVVFSNLSVGV